MTEVMGVTKKSEPLTAGISSGGVILRRVTTFKYLGNLVYENAISDRDITVRIIMAKAIFG